jgi:predicted dehydrogenase
MTTRRKFFTSAGLTTGVAITGSAGNPKNSTGIPTVELMKIGVIGLGENSHLNFSIWSPIINPVEPEVWPIRTTRMLITHAWDSRPEIAADYAKKYKCEAVKHYYDMVDKVDAMIFGGFNEAPWWQQLTKPYLEAGIPCFINRPLAYSMKDARAIVELAEKHHTPIMCAEERETFKEAHVGRRKVEELLAAGKTIIGVNSSNAAGEYPQHAIHGLVFLLALFGLNVERVSYQANGWWRDKIPAQPDPQNYGLLTLQYRGISISGGKGQTEPFMAAQHQFSKYIASDNTLRIYYSDGSSGGWWDLDQHDPTANYTQRLYSLFYPAVFAMEQMFETGKMPQSYDYILRKTRIFLTGFKSHLEHEGGLVSVDNFPDNWKAPNPYPNWIDESIFK